MSFAVDLAKTAVETFVRTGEPANVPDDVPEDLKAPAGAFVSLKISGMLRGCIGTIEPTADSAANEIIRSAILAASEDPRFMPVEEEELSFIEYSVDILEPIEPIETSAELNPLRFGCVVESKGRRGLLLPCLEGVDTADEQISICKQKAGIAPHEDVNLSRFKVTRYT